MGLCLVGVACSVYWATGKPLWEVVEKHPPWFILTGLAAVPAVLLTWHWRVKNKLAEIKVARDGVNVERFSQAIMHLSNREMDLKLGGIYALEQVARDSEAYFWPVTEILTSYVRRNSPRRTADDELSDSTDGRVKGVSPDIQAILTVLGRRRRRLVEVYELAKDRALHLAHTNLQAIVLDSVRLQRARLAGADIRGANVSKADLSRADLNYARLDNARLRGVTLDKANLYGAKLTGAKIVEETSLRGTILAEADLCGAFFDDSVDLGEASLAGAQYDTRTTTFPRGFDANVHEMRIVRRRARAAPGASKDD